MAKKFVFFSTSDFQKEGGGTIRMYGVLNSLAIHDTEIVFISNTQDYSKFHPKIKHIFLDFPLSQSDKRKFQFLLGTTPISLVNKVFKNLKIRLNEIYKDLTADEFYFFEYLDNSIGFWLFKNKIVPFYSNDVHGIAALEFEEQLKNSVSKKEKIALKLKEKVSHALDKKVFQNAKFLIFPSKAMENHFEKLYGEISEKKNVILPNLLSEDVINMIKNEELIQRIKKKYSISDNDKVLLFAGSFKVTSGVIDLIVAVEKLATTEKNIKLLILGDGKDKERILETIHSKPHLKNIIHFVGRTAHSDLPSYQAIADVLVCPDSQNVFSSLIVHLKYFDALLANKIVLNGSFPSVLEINPNEKLSVNFEPSNVQDLYEKLNIVLKNFDEYSKKYMSNRAFALENLTYKERIQDLL